jgi:hypothetical protein
MYTTSNTDLIGINSRLFALIEQFPEGCDPDFDTGLEEVEREFQELRLQLGRE